MTYEDQAIMLRLMKNQGSGIYQSFETEAHRSAWRDAQIMRIIEERKAEERRNRRKIQLTGSC